MVDLKSAKNSYDPGVIPVGISQSRDTEQEVSLVDVWRIIARRKGVILVTFAAFLLLAVGYLFFAQPLYKATAYLLPPRLQDIQGLLVNYGGPQTLDTERYTPQFVYRAFLANLNSQGLRRDFFDSHDLVKHYASGRADGNVSGDRIYDMTFKTNLQVQGDSNDPLSVTVSLIDTDPELAAQWVNEIIDVASERTIGQLSDDVNAGIQAEIHKIRYQLASKLKLAEQRRRDTIIGLKEALRVAQTLGIEDTSAFPKVANKAQAGLAVNTAQMPIYMRGTNALETEIAVLESRKSDEPFISGFRDLQERRAFLEGISIDLDTLSAVTVDAAATVPYKMVKPRWVLILLSAAVIGLVAGVFVAFLKEFFSKMQRGLSQECT